MRSLVRRVVECFVSQSVPGQVRAGKLGLLWYEGAQMGSSCLCCFTLRWLVFVVALKPSIVGISAL